jgi:hypothetical protein
MVNARKKLIQLTILLVAVFSLSLNSCSKKEVSVNLEGKEWIVYPPNVFIFIAYNPDISGSNSSLNAEAVLNIIKASLEEATAELRKLEKIIFKAATFTSEENVVEFYYRDETTPILGTYEQDGAYFTIKNATFPDGILGLSNNYELEIYYPRDYVQKILHNKTEIDLQTINSFIAELSGVGFYLSN